MKTLRVSNSSHSLETSIDRFHRFDKKVLTSGDRFWISTLPARVAGFEAFLSGRFWVFRDIPGDDPPLLTATDVTVGLELMKNLGEVLVTHTQLTAQVLLVLRTKLGESIEDALCERSVA